MKIELKLFATLDQYRPQDADAHPVEPGASAGDVADRLGIPREEIKLCFVNGVHAPLDVVLADGDRLGLFPAVGGG